MDYNSWLTESEEIGLPHEFGGIPIWAIDRVNLKGVFARGRRRAYT